MSPNSNLPADVLIVRLGAIGDVVNALTVAAALKGAALPPRIGWVVHELAAPLVRNNPLVDRVHLWSKGAGLAGLRGALREVRKVRYGLAIDLQRIAKSAAFARLSGAPRVLGWDRARAKEGAWLLVRERIAKGASGTHMVDHYADFARHLGLVACSPRGVLPVDSAGRARWAAEAQSWRGQPVVLNLGASKPANRWPAERFGAVAAALVAAGYQPLLTGGRADREAADVAKRTAGPEVVDLVGATSLPELAALLAVTPLFVGNDTGPMHMAVAMGARVLALFGPADPRRTGPFEEPGGARHRVLQHLDTDAGPSAWRVARTERLEVEEVLAAALALLRE